jgi:hypothetical protein
MRPPYSDVDDRIRAIAIQMGLTTILWSSVDGINFNTQDWQVAGGVVSDTKSFTPSSLGDLAELVSRRSLPTRWSIPGKLS